MGNGMCKSEAEPRAFGIDGFCHKMLFNYVKQWKSYPDKQPEKIKKRVKSRKKTKPTISYPIPADPEKLEGDKWRYVILTRLDTEKPTRPPRRQQCRRNDSVRFSISRRCSSRRKKSQYQLKTIEKESQNGLKLSRDSQDLIENRRIYANWLNIMFIPGRLAHTWNESKSPTIDQNTAVREIVSSKNKKPRRRTTSYIKIWLRTHQQQKLLDQSSNGLFRSLDRINVMDIISHIKVIFKCL
ncbi:uncharacterized protein LOC126904371 [Daktulosphaira vitifoliae]|uniref:uncharacterized protein LOC126904371 n=1 Tax=Daktulosphaira vitifoliae TaxID=58002 RepID=UPI0021AA75E3|nr:uncharacterized protein LOC126904371 [Daktulosphaira vitifoliae]